MELDGEADDSWPLLPPGAVLSLAPRTSPPRFPRPPPALHVNNPIWLRTVSTPGAPVFAIMFTLESLARATLATVIPLQAYAILKDARDVSALYFGVGVIGLAGSFTLPLLIRRFRRRWVYSMAAGLTIVAALLLATGTLAGQISGMLLRAFAVRSEEHTTELQ